MFRVRERRGAGSAGFTLIELLIVIVVIGILAGIAIFAIGAFRNDASGGACTADKRTLESAIEAYRGRTGSYPAALTDLTSSNYVADDGNFTATTKTGNGYTLTYTPASGALTTCAVALAAGGSGGGGGGGGGPTPSSTPTPTPTPTPSPTVATTYTVATTGSSATQGANNWRATATFKVTNNLGVALQNYTVTFTWSGSGAQTCSTSPAGTCSDTTGNISNGTPDTTVTVNNVTGAGGLTYVAPSNPSTVVPKP